MITSQSENRYTENTEFTDSFGVRQPYQRRPAKVSPIVSGHKMSDGDKQTATKIKAKLLRHLDSICPIANNDDCIEILRFINADDSYLASWHRNKIIGYWLNPKNFRAAEARLRIAITELIDELSTENFEEGDV